jgi:hypothetical protein
VAQRSFLVGPSKFFLSTSNRVPKEDAGLDAGLNRLAHGFYSCQLHCEGRCQLIEAVSRFGKLCRDVQVKSPCPWCSDRVALSIYR